MGSLQIQFAKSAPSPQTAETPLRGQGVSRFLSRSEFRQLRRDGPSVAHLSHNLPRRSIPDPTGC